MRDDEREDKGQHPLVKIVWVVLAITVLVGVIGIVLSAIGVIDVNK